MKFFTCLLLAVSSIGLVKCELKSVALLFRHGERTLSSTMPRYGDSELYRDLGAGQLTLRGSRQLYDNGVELRKRYQSLFPAAGYFRTSNMRLLSSSYDRCVASLTSFMAGFMPPPETDDTIPFPWQSIPLTVDNEARVLTWNPDACPKYAKEAAATLAAIEKDRTILGWMKEDYDVLTRVGDFMGVKVNSFNETFWVAEVIRTEQFLDPTMPTWLISAYDKLIRYFARFADVYHENDFMKTVRGGPMITQIVDNMMAIKNKNADAHKIILFSAHDFTLHSMNLVLNIKTQVPAVASYADTIAIELHQTGNKEPEVQVFYMNNSGYPKYKTQVYPPGCGTPCTLTNFNKITSKYFVRDFDGLCKL